MHNFEMTEDGRYILTAEQIGDLQASEFKVGYEAGARAERSARQVRLSDPSGGAWDDPKDWG